MSTPDFGDFAVQVRFENDRVVVAIDEDVDLVTAPTLAAILDGLIDQGHVDVVLDLERLTYLGADGLSVLLAASTRLLDADRTLTVWNVPTLTRRLLDLTRVGELMRFEAPSNPAGDSDSSGSDEEQVVVVPPVLRTGPRSSTEVVDAALRLVTALADATIDNADGVSVTLERHGKLMTVAASNDAVLEMDGHQYETGQGPCLAAKADDRWYYIESLADEQRWPEFVPLALEQGIHSILSSPLKTPDQPVGALNVYSTKASAFGDHEQKLAALFATQASDILTTAGAEISDEAANRKFAHALTARRTIAQAQGSLMQRHHVTTSAAVAMLRDQARAADATVLESATSVLAAMTEAAGPDTQGT